MKHRATPRFWRCRDDLPESVRLLADHGFDLLKQNPRHPSLHLKRVGDYWSVRVGMHHRALAVENAGDLIWFWIGSHAEYDGLVGRQ